MTSTSSSACREFTCCPCHGQRELCANADFDGVADIVDVDDVDVVDRVDIAENLPATLVMLNENFVQMQMLMSLILLMLLRLS